MANLALKAVMWGADKIPDSVFESIPGGYFKPKEHDEYNRRPSGSRDRRHSSDQYSDDGYDSHRRHHHHHNSSRRRHSEGRRHRARSRGQTARDSEDDSSDVSRRSRSRSHHQEHNRDDVHSGVNHYVPAEGYDGRYRRDSKHGGSAFRPPYPESNAERRTNDHHAFAQNGRATAAAATAGAAAVTAPHLPRSDTESRQSMGSARKSFTQGYVPYSEIYGHENLFNGHGHSATSGPPDSPIARPPHAQNPYAQDVAAGVQQPSYMVPRDEYDPRNDPYYYRPSVRDDWRASPASESATFYSRSPSPLRRNRADSVSHTSYESHSDRDRRRDRSARSQGQNAGRSKSRIRETFDPSQRALGYTAVGALGGALVGSEIGKGPLPALIGAVIGGAGTNAFKAREKRRDAKRNNLPLRTHPRRSVPSSTAYYSD